MKTRKIRKKETQPRKKYDTSPRNPRTIEGWFIKNGTKGQVIYTHKSDRFMTAIASYNNRKIKTERCVVINNSQKVIIKASVIVKVTLLDNSTKK